MTLNSWLKLFPEVIWSLYTDDEETIELYGFISQDFVLLKLGYTNTDNFDFIEIRTSSTIYRELFYNRIYRQIYNAESGGLVDLQLLKFREDLNDVSNIEREYVL